MVIVSVEGKTNESSGSTEISHSATSAIFYIGTSNFSSNNISEGPGYIGKTTAVERILFACKPMCGCLLQNSNEGGRGRCPSLTRGNKDIFPQ